MQAKVLRFDVGFGRPELAEQLAARAEAAMSAYPGFRSTRLLADYLGGRYLLLAFWDSADDLYTFSYSADATTLEDFIDRNMVKVPLVGEYEVYQPGGAAVH